MDVFSFVSGTAGKSQHQTMYKVSKSHNVLLGHSNIDNVNAGITQKGKFYQIAFWFQTLYLEMGK